MKIELKCRICDNKFWVDPYRRNTAKYCSMQCLGIANGNRTKGKRAPWVGKPKVNRICLICGKRLEVYLSQRYKGFCCSRKCADRWHSIRMKRPLNQLNLLIKILESILSYYRRYLKTLLVEYSCEWCGICWMIKSKSLQKDKQKHFCCESHYKNWLSKNMLGKNNHQYGKNPSGKDHPCWKGGPVEKKCFYCEKVFYIRRNRAREGARFCSTGCYHKWCSGENNYAWAGGISTYWGTEFKNELKIEIRERDNHQCQLCRTRVNRRKFPIHHKNYNKHDNKKDNLIVLCDPCHGKTNSNRDYWENYFMGKIEYTKEVGHEIHD